MKYILLVLVVLLFIVSPFVFLPRFLKITKIDCESQFGPCSEIVENSISGFYGKSLKDTRKDLEKALAANDKVDSFSVTFNLPSSLKVFVVEKKATTAIAKKDLGTYVLIDDKANVVGFSDKTQLPVIALDDGVFDLLKEKMVVGQNLGEDLSFAASLVNGIYSLYQVRICLMTADTIEFKIKDSIVVVFPKSGDAEALLGSLQLILAKVSGEIPIHNIDLRFKNPVVK